MTAADILSPHPLDGRDEDECYKTMMAERTALITSRRESEDNLIKTIIQLASGLLVLSAGFVAQEKLQLSYSTAFAFYVSVAALTSCIMAGLLEQFFSSKAYQEQQVLLEGFYTKRIDTFGEAPSNRFVRGSQVTAFAFFVLGLGGIAAFAVIQAGGKIHVSQESTSTSTSTSTPSTSTSTSTSTPPTSASTAPSGERSSRERGKIGSAVDAPAASEEKVKDVTSDHSDAN